MRHCPWFPIDSKWGSEVVLGGGCSSVGEGVVAVTVSRVARSQRHYFVIEEQHHNMTNCF